MQHPNHLLVLVNGLWGWQRDWGNMKKALDNQQDGSYHIHVSAVNVGPQTYEGCWCFCAAICTLPGSILLPAAAFSCCQATTRSCCHQQL
jgi:hypothetical protein